MTTTRDVADEAVRRHRWSLRHCPYEADGAAIRMWLIFHGLDQSILEECRRIRAKEPGQ